MQAMRRCPRCEIPTLQITTAVVDGYYTRVCRLCRQEIDIREETRTQLREYFQTQPQKLYDLWAMHQAEEGQP